MAARKWSDAQRAKQSELIRNWKPWQHSTGAKTPEGKAISSMNAEKGYWRRRLRYSSWLLWARNNTVKLTPELIAETYRRAEKLNCFNEEHVQYWLNKIGEQ